MRDRMLVLEGDITQQMVDAIVNPANEEMLGGGGVDGAIHRAAGPLLLGECRKIGYCATGDAKITKGYNLPATWIIHTVGPVWEGGSFEEETLLAQCYRNCLNLAVQYDIRTIAFAAISTGSYGFPMEEAGQVATGEVYNFLLGGSTIKEVRFVCFTPQDYACYQKAINVLLPSTPQ